MLSARGSSVILLVTLMVHVCCANIPFSWSDCGVQLNKALHYKSASISPDIATQGKPLSINVQATVANIVYNAETRLMVWKDGDLFLDVYIEDLCDIITHTKGLTCPLSPGQVSFSYEFAQVPAMPSGDYVIDIRSYAQTAGQTEADVIGCVEFKGTVVGVHDNKDCFFSSNLTVGLSGDIRYTTSDRASRKLYNDTVQIGPIGSSSNPSAYGSIASYVGTEDVGGTIQKGDIPFSWALNGTLTAQNVSAQRIINTYSGNVYFVYTTGSAIAMRGLFNMTFDYDTSTQFEKIEGIMWFDPTYYLLSDQYAWPVIIGNLGPFTVEFSQSDGVFVVKGGREYCTCGEDPCGVCGGNGNTCDYGHKHHSGSGWGPRKKAAVACGAIALLLIIVVAELSRRIRRERRKIPIDDEDLVDHPEKPDYGTMAIDDAIREGERVV